MDGDEPKLWIIATEENKENLSAAIATLGFSIGGYVGKEAPSAKPPQFGVPPKKNAPITARTDDFLFRHDRFAVGDISFTNEPHQAEFSVALRIKAYVIGGFESGRLHVSQVADVVEMARGITFIVTHAKRAQESSGHTVSVAV